MKYKGRYIHPINEPNANKAGYYFQWGVNKTPDDAYKNVCSIEEAKDAIDEIAISDTYLMAVNGINEWLKAGLKPKTMNEKLKALVWKLDREIWAKVEKQEATTSWGREQSAILIQQYTDELLVEMVQALKSIERICDNQNPTHEDIWRITNYVLTRYHESQKP